MISITAQALRDWLDAAKPGEAVIYLAGSRAHNERVVDGQREVMALARQLYLEGRVELAQRRVGKTPSFVGIGKFEWLCIKRRGISPRPNVWRGHHEEAAA
jgi:hypothetical protein